MKRAPDYDVAARDVPRDRFPGGRVRFSLGTSDRRRVRTRKSACDTLRREGAWDILQAISDGKLSVATASAAVQQNGTSAIAELRDALEALTAGPVPTYEKEAGLDDPERKGTYLEWYARKRAPQSFRNTRSRLKRLGEQIVTKDGVALKDFALDKILHEHADMAVELVSDRPGTRFNLTAAGSGFINWSRKRELERAKAAGRAPRWTENPFSGIEIEDRTPRQDTFSRPQIAALLEAGQLYQKAYVRGLLQLGLRIMEFAHLRLELDLSLNDWTCRIQKRGPDPRCLCDNCRERGWRPKTRNGTREFLIPAAGQPMLRPTIMAYLEAHPCEPGDFVFRNPRTGGVWTDSALRKDFMDLCEKAGVTYGRDEEGGVTLHSFRHTSITEWVRAGVRESVIAAFHGDTIKSIMAYVHLTTEDLGDGLTRAPSYA